MNPADLPKLETRRIVGMNERESLPLLRHE